MPHSIPDRSGLHLVQVLFICGLVGLRQWSLSTRVAAWLTACFLPADYVFVVTIKPAASAASAHTERFKADLMVCLHEYPPPALALALLPFLCAESTVGAEPADQGRRTARRQTYVAHPAANPFCCTWRC